MKKYIDIESWARKDQYKLFKEMDYPHFNITANVDITKTYSYTKERNLSFFKTMVYITTFVANNIKEFRYRICNDKVVEYDDVHPSFTFLTQPDAFSFCTIDYTEDFKEFLKTANNKVEELKGKVNVEDDPNRNDRLFITSMPWVSFTSVTHPIHMNPVDSVPRIAWGKYFEENNKLKLPLSVQVNHVLMDGIHVGKYFLKIEEILDNPEKYLKLK